MKLVNPRTGKEYRGLAVPSKQCFPEPLKYVSMFSHGLERLSELKLTKNEAAILFKFLSVLEFENWIRISQKTIAEDLNLKESNVSSSVKKLLKLGVIERDTDPSDRRKSIYRLNPSFGWRGSPKEWFENTTGRELEPNPPCYIR